MLPQMLMFNRYHIQHLSLQCQHPPFSNFVRFEGMWLENPYQRISISMEYMKMPAML